MEVGEPGNEVFCVRYSNDDNYLATGMTDGKIKLYNATTGKIVSTMAGPSLPITCLRYFSKHEM
jgi:WD40 repeat protein